MADSTVEVEPKSAEAPMEVAAAQEVPAAQAQPDSQEEQQPDVMGTSPEAPKVELPDTALDEAQALTQTMQADRMESLVPAQPEALLPAENSDDEMQVQCKKCGRQVHVIETTHRTEKIRWCLACNALVTLMWRHMSWPPEEFAKLDEQHQRSFFITAIEEKSGGFRYERVRDLLIKQMTKVHISESRKETGGTYKPLSVFQKKGYVLPASFENEAPKLWSEPLKCWTYLLPELTVKESEVTRSMEEAILRAEKSARKRKAVQGEGDQPRPLEIADDMVVDLLSESDEENRAGQGVVASCQLSAISFVTISCTAI